jgi:hypothetical protein
MILIIYIFFQRFAYLIKYKFTHKVYYLPKVIMYKIYTMRLKLFKYRALTEANDNEIE